MEQNFEEMMNFIKEAANAPATSSTLDVLSMIKSFENTRSYIHTTVNELGGLCEGVLESSAPDDIKKELVSRLDLLRRIDAQYHNVVNSLKGLLPLMQELDMASMEARERAKNILEEMGDSE